MASNKKRVTRRQLLKGTLGAGIALSVPHLWIPKLAFAQCEGRGTIKHLLYIRLNGGFRFTTAFNGNVASEFNPFGQASGLPAGVEWGVGRVMESTPWTNGDNAAEVAAFGLQSVPALSNHIAVIPCVDHEPLSGSADGNHGSGLERYFTGYAGGETSFFTMINYGLRACIATGSNAMSTNLPAFVLGESGMALGSSLYAGYRSPVLEGTSLSALSSQSEVTLPSWAKNMSHNVDVRKRDRQHPLLQSQVEAYIQTRDANERFNSIFRDPALDIENEGDEPIDGLSQAQLRMILGESGAARSAHLALRLFHFGCPAVYLGQGGWDMHSDEEENLPTAMGDVNQLISGLYAALHTMAHPEGGTYWDHTLVVFGSEFGRTTRGSRFNSARGSDHAGDLATRWMSMPLMGGVIDAAGKGGRVLGQTRSSDLKAEGKVYSYRALLKTLMDMLGAEHAEFFPADPPFNDLVT